MSRAFVTGAVFLALASTASAQDVNSDPLVLRQCLGQASDPLECVGQMARDCRDRTPDHPPLFTEDLCAIVEALEWDAYASDLASLITASAQAEDDKATGWTANLPKQAVTFQDAQKSWAAHRDANCEYQGARLGGDARRQVTESLCRLQMNAERFVTLKKLREVTR